MFGNNLSLGLQKVIFLIRGILKDNTDIYIFDEPLTSLDKDTRTKIIRLINDKIVNKTLIIISHDSEISQIVNKTIKLSELNSIASN